MSRSTAELLLATQLEQAGIPFDREFTFAAPRRFRADFIAFGVGPPYPIRTLLIEVEGGVYQQGRHVRGLGFESGCEKQALAVIAGYRYLRCTPSQVNDGRALAWIEAALGLERERVAS